MQKKYRLSGRRTFSYIYRKGNRASGKYMSLIYTPSRYSVRIGVVAGKKVGKSVVRNKVRRRIKEIARGLIPYIEHGCNYIVVAGANASGATFSQLAADFKSVFERAGRMKDSKGAEAVFSHTGVPGGADDGV